MESKFFGRRYSLTIGDETFVGDGSVDSMDIKFDVEYALGQICRFGTVSVLGLSFKKMSQFTALAALARGTALSKRLRVKLDAGYGTEAGIENIIDGWAYYATITTPPEMWLTLKVQEASLDGGVTCTINIDSAENLGVAVEYGLNKFSEAEGLKGNNAFQLQDFTKTSDTPKGLLATSGERSFNSEKAISLTDFISKLNSEDNGKVVFLMRGRILGAYAKQENQPPKGILLLDKDNGLLSVSGLDPVSADITSFLMKRQPYLCTMQLKSEFNPQANGKYKILKAHHIGHYYGNEWYTQYHCSNRLKK